MATGRDFYDVLGVARNASADDIQRAYRKLARTYHPDVNKDPTAEERFKEVSEAYDVLSDPDTRGRYDAFGADFRQVPEGVDPATWARAGAGARVGGGGARRSGGGRGGGRGPDEGVWFSSGFDGDDIGIDIDDLFGGMFGGRSRGPRSTGPVAGADQEAEVTISVEEAYRGTKRSITLSGPDGQRTLDVNIPAGVTDGQRIRLAGQGGQGSGGGARGNLYLVVRLAPDPRFRVEGHNLLVDLKLAPWEAALGASVAVETPGGEAKLRVPAGTSSCRRLRLRGRGLPRRRGEAGDLFAEVRIMVPSKLTSDERRLFQELAAASTFDPRKGR
jgi:curved DNA-binding protein